MIDVDSFVGEVCGRLKQGAAYGYTQLLGYHPLLATRADTREALHIRLRKGSANTQKGMLRFTDELIARVRRAGATGAKLLRADSGFWNTKVFERLEKAGWQYSIGVRMIKTVRAAVEAIDEHAWQTIEDYPEEGEAQIAETVYAGRRLVVPHMRTTLVLDALKMALGNRRPGADVALVHHSDRGSQYTSIDYTRTLADHGVLASLGSVGDAFDNALAESFVDSFKTELIADRVWRSRSQLELAVVEYIGWFNDSRLHQSLGDLPPSEFETLSLPSTFQISLS